MESGQPSTATKTPAAAPGYPWGRIALTAATAGLGFYAAGAFGFEWPTFWAVGLGIQGGMVAGALAFTATWFSRR